MRPAGLYLEHTDAEYNIAISIAFLCSFLQNVARYILFQEDYLKHLRITLSVTAKARAEDLVRNLPISMKR